MLADLCLLGALETEILHWGVFCLLLAGSLCHKDRLTASMHVKVLFFIQRPYAIEAARLLYGALDARAGSLWHKNAGRAIPGNSPRH